MTRPANRILQTPDPLKDVLKHTRLAEVIQRQLDCTDRIRAMTRAMTVDHQRLANIATRLRHEPLTVGEMLSSKRRIAKPKVETLPLSQKETHDRLRDKHWCYF